MLYSRSHMAAVGIKGLFHLFMLIPPPTHFAVINLTIVFHYTHCKAIADVVKSAKLWPECSRSCQLLLLPEF